MTERLYPQEDPVRLSALQELVEKGFFTEEEVMQIREEDMRTTLAKVPQATNGISEMFAQRRQGLQRARQTLEESGVGCMLKQLEKEEEVQSIYEYQKPRKKIIHYIISSEHAQSYVDVNEKGTILFRGAYVIGRTKLKEKKWKKNPELIGKALTKSLKHPNIIGN